MQALESKNFENHVMEHHFNEIDKNTISEKNVPNALDTSKISKRFKQKVFGQKRLLSSSKLSVKKHAKIQSPEKLVCDTCKKEMDLEICRIVITGNVDGGPQFFSFHFFPPCWNFDDFCQENPNLSLDRMLFDIPENMSMSENSIKDLQSNLSFWK